MTVRYQIKDRKIAIFVLGLAAPAVLAIVAFGILPVILLGLGIRYLQPGHPEG